MRSIGIRARLATQRIRCASHVYHTRRKRCAQASHTHAVRRHAIAHATGYRATSLDSNSLARAISRSMLRFSSSTFPKVISSLRCARSSMSITLP